MRTNKFFKKVGKAIACNGIMIISYTDKSGKETDAIRPRHFSVMNYLDVIKKKTKIDSMVIFKDPIDSCFDKIVWVESVKNIKIVK